MCARGSSVLSPLLEWLFSEGFESSRGLNPQKFSACVGLRLGFRSSRNAFPLKELDLSTTNFPRFARNAFPLKKLDLSTQILRFQRRRRRGTPKSVSVAHALTHRVPLPYGPSSGVSDGLLEPIPFAATVLNIETPSALS